MELIRNYYNDVKELQYSEYDLKHQLTSDQIVDVVNLLKSNNIQIESIAVENIGEEGDFFREFYEKLDQFYVRFPMISEENIYSVTIVSAYNGAFLGISFGNGLNDLAISYEPNMNIEPLAVAIDELCQKKTKGMR